MGPILRGQGAPGQRRLSKLLGFGSVGETLGSASRGLGAGGLKTEGLWGGRGGGRGLNTKAANTAGAATETGAPPASRERPEEGSAMAPPLYSGKGSGASGIRKRLMQLNYYNADRAQKPMWDAIDDLIGQANTNRFSPEGRAQFLAPRMEALDQSFRASQGQAVANLAARGMEGSSLDEATLGPNGSMATGYAGARAGLVNSLYGAEEQRQLQSQALLRDLLMGLQGRSSQQAAGVADSITNFRLQQQQLDAMNNPWATFGGIVGSAAGMAGGLGWSPFKPPVK